MSVEVLKTTVDHLTETGHLDVQFAILMLILVARVVVSGNDAPLVVALMCDLIRDLNSRSGQAGSAKGEEQAPSEGPLAQKVRRFRYEVIKEISRGPRAISPAAPGGLPHSELLGLLRVTAGQRPRLERKAPPTEKHVAATAEMLQRLQVLVGKLVLVLHHRGADMRTIAAVQRLQAQFHTAAPAVAQAREAAIQRVHMQKVTPPAPGFKIPPAGGGFARR